MDINCKCNDLIGLKVIAVSDSKNEKKVQVGTLVEW